MSTVDRINLLIHNVERRVTSAAVWGAGIAVMTVNQEVKLDGCDIGIEMDYVTGHYSTRFPKAVWQATRAEADGATLILTDAVSFNAQYRAEPRIWSHQKEHQES